MWPSSLSSASARLRLPYSFSDGETGLANVASTGAVLAASPAFPSKAASAVIAMAQAAAKVAHRRWWSGGGGGWLRRVVWRVARRL